MHDTVEYYPFDFVDRCSWIKSLARMLRASELNQCHNGSDIYPAPVLSWDLYP